MMYKGHKGLMLCVSVDLKFGNLGNEDSGDGPDEFFSIWKNIPEIKGRRHSVSSRK